MNQNEKKELLNSLNETEFRQDLIIPLLSKMGFYAPLEYHGTNERGKDIICFEYDKLKEQRFLSIVAKVGDLTGDVSTNKGLSTIVNQVNQSFDCPYENLYNMKQVLIDEVWVMTTGKIVSGAEESIIRTLRKNNLDKLIRIIGNDRLIQLIDDNFSTYWNSNAETKESVIIQRDRLLRFIEEILKMNSIDSFTIESIKSAILYSNYSPSVKTNIDGLRFSDVSPYSIEMSKIDPSFDDYIYSSEFGMIQSFFAKVKKELSYSFFDIEETMEHANKISKIINPQEFVDECQYRLPDSYPFHNSAYGAASDFLTDLNYLENGLRDLFYFKKYLEKQGKLSWAKKISKSIFDLQSEIDVVIRNSENEVVVNYAISEEKAYIAYNNNDSNICFSTKHPKIKIIEQYNRSEEKVITANTIIDSALAEFRKYLEKSLNYIWHEWIENYEEE